MNDLPPLVVLPFEAETATGVNPTVTVNKIPRYKVFYVSVMVDDTTEGAELTFNGAPPREVTVGAELGTTRYVAPFDIFDIQLTTTGGTLSVWLDPGCPPEQCGR